MDSIISRSKSALDVLQSQQEQDGIVTFCQALDTLLGGGIQLGKITELFGVPGIGKTQICIQLACATHIPRGLGGQAGEVVWLDTEGSLVASRLMEVATATVEHCKTLGDPSLSVERILQGVHYFRCLDDMEVLSVMQRLPKFLQEHEKVKLIIMDSVAAPFKYHHDNNNLSLRTQVLATQAQTLNQLAHTLKLAVVLTNHMTTRVRSKEAGQGQGQGSSYLVPALGDSWGHACAVRLRLQWADGGAEWHGGQGSATGSGPMEDWVREVHAVKTAHADCLKCCFRITESGIRDVAQAVSEVKDTWETSDWEDAQLALAADTAVEEANTNNPPPLKRQKIS